MALSKLKGGAAKKRRLARFLKRAEPVSDLIGLVLIVSPFFYYLPLEVFNRLPATGGDTGSHFWPLYTLFNYGLPNGSVRVWNPGNLAGEPHFVHYFPFPYLVMALLGLFLPLGAAFNWGTLLPVLFLPLSVYFCLRMFRERFPAPLLGSAASLLFLYNESFSMWGGNFNSMLAGQFAHVYALDLLFLGCGFLAWELRRRRMPLLSSVVFCALACSHAYVFLVLPFFFLSFWLFFHYGTLRERFVVCLLSGIFSILLSLWFVLPMADNNKWTTPFRITWEFFSVAGFFKETVPPIFYPMLVVLVLASLLNLALWLTTKRPQNLTFTYLIWVLPSLAYVGMYFLFPLVGLVDVRAFPQIQLFLCILTGTLVGVLVRRNSRVFGYISALPITVACIWWTNSWIVNLPSWLKWNYSGWTVKPLYEPLTGVSNAIRGSFSDPRVAYEHNDVNNGAGTVRVFEMLPYFSGRATLESTYLQATIVAPEVFYLQALISKTPSCPFREYPCPHFELGRAEPKLRDLGVGELILTTSELISDAAKQTYLKEHGQFGPWRVFRLEPAADLVEVFTKPPELVTVPDWKKAFFDWFTAYTGKENLLVQPEPSAGLNSEELTALVGDRSVWQGDAGCAPSVTVEFNRIVLHTACPGKAHLLRFAYHPSFRADNGEKLFLVSPGFIGLVPKEKNVVLTFGRSPLWRFSSGVSVFSALLLLLLWRSKKARAFLNNGPS